MIEDPVAVAGMTAREVRTGSRDGATTKIAIARRTYPTDRADLWDAITNAERLPRWFLSVSGDLRVGGRYQFEGNAGGVIERCEAPASLVVTWESGEMISWLTVNLLEADRGTTLELVHEAPVDPQMWGQFGPGAVGVGWDLAITLGLAEHIDTGAAVDPEQALAFPQTPAGVEFVRAAATGWADAAIAGGDDADAARRAAERTIAFYTGQQADGGTEG